MGTVQPIGWDFGQVAEGITNDYLIASPLAAGTTFTATLTWFRDRQLIGITGYSEGSFDNLDLELWSAIGGVADHLISTSNSIYNNTEHFSFAIPSTTDYMLRVRWTSEVFDSVSDANVEQYGLAWGATASVPEPATCSLVAIALLVCLPGRPRRR
jgi:hypothetical protein